MAEIKISINKVKSAFNSEKDAYMLNIDHFGLGPIKCREYMEYSHAEIARSIFIYMIKDLNDPRELDVSEFEFNRKAIFQFLGIKETI